MSTKYIQEISEKVFGEKPLEVIRKTIGICNEVFELEFPQKSYILRINKEKGILYGTHKFLPLFEDLQIKTPKILAEDYSKNEIPICYQILTKLEGEDIGLVINKLSDISLKKIALEVSNIFDKFNSLQPIKGFGEITGSTEENYSSLLEVLEKQRETILVRNGATKVIDTETLEIYNKLLLRYKNYFLDQSSKLYYDDICSKNVMVENGEFRGLVDLDFLMKGDYLEAIGRMMASWYGETAGSIYVKEIIRLQNLNTFQQKIVRLYAIFNLIYWTSEEGIKFNSNSSGLINKSRIKSKKRKILGLLNELNILEK